VVFDNVDSRRELILTVDDLWTGYRGVTVVKGVSIKVGLSDAVFIIGANGAGKSSLLDCIAGILPIQKGKVFLGGEDITHMAPHLRASRGLFLVRERSQILATMSVLDNLKLVAFASLKRVGKEKFNKDIEKAFDIFPKLKGKENRVAGTLSGGEQRMLALAQAFVANPEIMLLDEPFLGLAPLVIEDILQVIQNFRKEKVSILLVEQNASLALEMADRGYVMKTGKVILEGPRDLISGNENIKPAYLGTTLTPGGQERT
jgi:branched-chain amino acid transport system ATP-binding protein